MINLVSGQSKDLYLEQISARDGLTHNRITFLHQDMYGYIWAGTAHGLNQLDGTNIHTYRMRPDDLTSLPANYISQIMESPTGEIWLTFAVGGVTRFNRSERNFKTFAIKRDSLVKPSAFVYDMAWDSAGIPWLATDNGLFRYDLAQDSVLPVFTEPDSLLGTTRGAVRLRYDGSTLLIVGDLGVWAYSQRTNRLEKVKLMPGNEPANGFVWAMSNKSSPDIWMNVHGEGVVQWRNGALHRVEKNIQVPADEWGQPNRDSLKMYSPEAADFSYHPSGEVWFSNCGNRIYKIVNNRVEEVFIEGLPKTCRLIFDGKGNLFGITPDQQIFAIDYQAGTWMLLHNVNSKAENSGTNSIISVIKDDKGHLWFGSYERGIYHQHPDRMGFRLYQGISEVTSSNYVTSIAETRNGKFWISTRGGLASWDREKDSFEWVGIPRMAHRVMVDRKDRLWVGTRRGAVMLNDKGVIQKVYEISTEEPPFGHAFMAEDQIGNIWLAHRAGMLEINPETGQLTSYTEDDPRIENGRMVLGAHCFYQDKDGNNWVGSVRYGLVKMAFHQAEGKEIQFSSLLYPGRKNNTLRAQTVNYITEDHDGKLWLGCYSSGLLRFDPLTNKFEAFPLADGNVIPNIQGILEDDAGLLWISSSNGLYCFDPAKRTWRRYTESDGLQSNLFNRSACWKAHNGDLYFGGMDGLSVFDPMVISGDAKAGPVILQDILVKGSRLEVDQPFETLEELSLNYDENNLEIKFVSVDFLQSERLTYAYKLEGLDERWTNSANPWINYKNLPAGKYNLRIKAEVPGMTQEAPERILKISVAPPFWETPWFYSIIILMITGLAYLAHLLRLRGKERKFREIEKIRKKAAADFHDELGHRLTRISLFAEVMQVKSGKEEKELQEYLEKIKTNSRELYQSMRNFLWALDPEKDAAAELAIILKDFGDDMFDKTGISFQSDYFPLELHGLCLNMDWKRHLLLIFKEAMHNTLKHSGASNVHLKVDCDRRMLTIILKDDGHGFEREIASNGYGMRSMADRAERLQGKIKVDTEIGKGTSVIFNGIVPAT